MKAFILASAIGFSLVLQGCNQTEQQAAAPEAAAPDMPGMPMPGAPAGTLQGAMYTTTGEVTSVGADSVTIQHQPVAELGWPAMSMTFKAPRAAMLDGLAAGSQVGFSFREEGSDYVLTVIQHR